MSTNISAKRAFKWLNNSQNPPRTPEFCTLTNKPSMQDISWGILHRNIHDIRTRKIIEELEIRKHENVMNGFIGRTLNLD